MIRLRHDITGPDHAWLAHYDRFFSRKQYGVLSEAEVGALSRYQVDTVTADFSSRSKGGLTLAQHEFLSALAQMIRDHKIASAANIGARVDHFSAELAARFPAVQFYSVDFQGNLALHNSLLPQRDNWHFRSGYPLHLIRDGTVRADLYFFVSTSVLMNNAEINAYLDAMTGHARVLAFCEGWWPSAERLDLRVRRPETIPEEEPYCGGEYANYHHNYIAKLRRRGYRIASSEIVPEGAGYHYLQLFAARSS
jgi:hypothetical protein